MRRFAMRKNFQGITVSYQISLLRKIDLHHSHMKFKDIIRLTGCSRIFMEITHKFVWYDQKS